MMEASEQMMQQMQDGMTEYIHIPLQKQQPATTQQTS
jgi:hypothetical protein